MSFEGRLLRADSIDDIMELKRWLGERRSVLAIDTETEGLVWTEDKVRLFCIGDTETGWVIPAQRWVGAIKELIEPYSGPIAMHNLTFDLRMIEEMGVKVPRNNLHDTMVMAHLLDPQWPKGLKPVAARVLDPAYRYLEQRLDEHKAKTGWTWSTIPDDDPIYWGYGAMDGVLTARLFEKIYPAPRQQMIYQIEIASALVIADMEKSGILIDTEYAERAADHCRQRAHQLRTWATETYKIDNPTSGPQLAELFLNETDWEPVKFGKSGDPSMDKEVLAGIQHPLAAVAQEIRGVEKMASTYLDNISDFVASDGRLHANINPLGAKTGRMSMNRPSLHNLPREDPIVRDCFVSGEGQSLVLCDYDQIELRLLAHFADEPQLNKVFEIKDLDAFSWMARQVYRDDTIVKSDRRRQITKTATYAKIFGSGLKTFCATAGISLAEGKAFNQSFDEMFPGVARFQSLVQQTARSRKTNEGRAYVTTPMGRPQAVDETRMIYKLVNHLIQGTAADVMKSKLVELDNAGMGSYLRFPVHDEIVAEVPDEELAEVVPEMERVMLATEYKVPLTAGAEVYKRWGEKYRV